MSSDKLRHRDRDPGRRQFDDEDEPVAPNRVFRITDADRQLVVKHLRYIDEVRRELERQQNRENREIVRELRASADRIFEVMNGLEAAPREATSAISGFHLFPFGGLRKAGNWLRAYPKEARETAATTRPV